SRHIGIRELGSSCVSPALPFSQFNPVFATSCPHCGLILLQVLRIDTDFRKAYWHGVDLQLTPTEFAPITQFAARPAAVINFAELHSVLKGEHLPPGEARTRMKPHVANLRQKYKRRHQTFLHQSERAGDMACIGILEMSLLQTRVRTGNDTVLKVLYVEDNPIQA
ncbi:MAG: hypothetical protein ACYDEO_28880, partial [Aggregatilineales bacterium]